MQKNK